MGVGGHQTGAAEPDSGKAAGVYSWEEVEKHRSRNDRWLVINRKVYNISQWAKRHPGGSHVIGHYAGEDATVNMSPLYSVVITMQNNLLSCSSLNGLANPFINCRKDGQDSCFLFVFLAFYLLDE